ncbi:MAG TPA: hypothetical protein VF503_11325 [Sphingobium sp.]|uniref:hypothetical protein n=1 Tax=Sphingobium sp. TaxID=1912891 RepID=UPI002ED05018
MMTRFAAAFAAFALITASASPVLAASCKDAKGKFVKCPEKKAPVKKAPCKDAKGKFTKCK